MVDGMGVYDRGKVDAVQRAETCRSAYDEIAISCIKS